MMRLCATELYSSGYIRGTANVTQKECLCCDGIALSQESNVSLAPNMKSKVYEEGGG